MLSLFPFLPPLYFLPTKLLIRPPPSDVNLPHLLLTPLYLYWVTFLKIELNDIWKVWVPRLGIFPHHCLTSTFSAKTFFIIRSNCFGCCEGGEGGGDGVWRIHLETISHHSAFYDNLPKIISWRAPQHPFLWKFYKKGAGGSVASLWGAVGEVGRFHTLFVRSFLTILERGGKLFI